MLPRETAPIRNEAKRRKSPTQKMHLEKLLTPRRGALTGPQSL